MSKLSVLDMTQDILSDMNSDDVDSITDSVESLQVAQIIRSVYFEMMSRKNWPHLHQLFKLEASGDVAKPTHMKIPTGTKEITKISYESSKVDNTKITYTDVQYLTPDEFIRRLNDNNSDQEITDTIQDFSGVTLLIKNNASPDFYTSFDDEWVVFESYDNEIASTLLEDNTQCLAYVTPEFVLQDSHVPDMPAEMFPALLAEAKSTCFVRIKQEADAKAEQQSKRQMSWLSSKAWRAGDNMFFPDYGRRGRKNRGRDNNREG